MTKQADFTEEAWETVVEGPTSAGMVVAASQKGGTFRESMAMAKAWTEARKQHGESELLDEIVSSRPKMDRTGARSPEELKTHGLDNIREALAVLEPKATPEEVEQYKQFTLGLAQKVAEAAKDVSSEEEAAISEIAQTLGLPSTG